MAVAMALHELVTNAAKYGALSTAEGHVRLQFRRDGEGALVLEWSESGGPEVVPPRRRGFGSLLIEGSMKTEVGGSAEVRYLRSGLVCVMTVPAAEVVSREEPPDAALAQAAGEGASAPDSAGARILLVEDPAAGGLETRRRLEAFGYRVLGPAGTMGEAVRLADSADFEAAIIDINLGERDVFPVLDILVAHGVPIAFVTAYKLLRLPPRYRDCLVLTRPLGREAVRRMFEAGAGSLRLLS
jgi:CheY-like chemotaxis protein